MLKDTYICPNCQKQIMLFVEVATVSCSCGKRMKKMINEELGGMNERKNKDTIRPDRRPETSRI